MTKQFKLFLTMLMLTLVGSAAWAQEVSYDFTGSDWTVSNGVLTDGTVTITGEGSANFKMNSGYFFMGKSGAYITLPAYDFDVEKIEVVGRSGASGDCKQNIFVDDVAVSTETKGVTGTNTYEIDEDYQAAGTRYTIKVTSSHNSQITAIKIYKAGGVVVQTVATPTFSPGGGIFTESQEVEISCTTDDATIYYTIDGTAPTTSSSVYSSAIPVEETTTIKAFAVKEGMNNSAVASATYTIKVADPDWIDFTIQGFSNAEDVTTVTGPNGSVTFAKGNGSNPPKWYDSGSAVRIYTNNTITITAEEGKKIESVEFSITSGSMSADKFDVDGTYANSIFTLTTPANSIVYTTSSNFRLDKIKINLSSDTREEAGLSYSDEEYTATIDGQNEFPTLSNPNELAVSYESTNEDVATIDESGNVTLVAAGTTTIKATSEETDTYLAGSASYTLTVIDPNVPGMSADNPYTVAQARAAIDNEIGINGVYVTGIVSEIVSVYNSQFGNISYNISADGSTDGDQLQAYRGKSYNGDNFTSENDIQVGDVVVIYGNLQNYQGTYELAANNQLVSLERPAQPKYYVAGTWTNWGTDMIEMTKSSDGSFTLADQQLAEGAEFKIVKVDPDATDPVWCGGQADGNQYWFTADNHTDISLVVGGGANFYMPMAGTWNITVSFNATDGAPLITVDGSWPETTYYLAGDFNDWNTTATPLTKNADGTYTISQEIAFDEKFKIVDNYETWYGAVGDGDFWVNANISDSPITMSTTGNNLIMKADNDNAWTLTFNPADMSLIITGWPVEPGTDKYELVTDASTLAADDEIIIAYVDIDAEIVAQAMSATQAANNRPAVEVVYNDDETLTPDATAQVITLERDEEGWYFNVGDGYLYAASSSKNWLRTEAEADDNAKATIEIAENGDATIIFQGDFERNHMRYNYNNGSPMFACYAESSTVVTLPRIYRKVAEVEDEFISVTISDIEYATLYYSDKAFEIPEGVTAKIVTGFENGKIQFEDLDGIIPAGTGVVLNGSEGTYDFKVVDVDLTAPANNLLRGFDVPHLTEGGDIYYMLSLNAQSDPASVGFYWGEEDGDAFETGAHKAYLALLDDGNNAKSFYLFNDEVIVTGINAVETAEQGAAIYNLNGQRVNKAQKGLYIMNGKKVVVK